MHFRIWQTMLPLTALLRLDETFFAITRTRAIIARVRHLLCHARLISVVILHISEACPKKRYVFLVRLIGMACLSPRLRILVEFLQEIYMHLYDGRIKTNSTLVTDKMNSYVRFPNANGIDLVQLKTGKAKKGIYNIQHINSYHSQLKRFMRGFNGVSTK